MTSGLFDKERQLTTPQRQVPTVITLSLSMPSRYPAHLLALLRERFANVELPDRVESIALTAAETMHLAPRNVSFFPDR